MRCPKCGFDNLAGTQFCGHCGVPLPRACPSCAFLNPPDHRFCGQCGARLAGQPAPATPTPPTPPSPALEQLEGERHVITTMFADVKGSTALAEQIDVESWVEIMNHVLQVLSAEIHRYGGEVDRYEGDGLVAFFGLSTSHEEDAERAVLAALAMQEAIRRYAAELMEDEGIELLLRVGLSTGEVIAAHVGDARQHGEDTAMGRAIAVAARLEPAAEPGTVLVSENTYRLLAPVFDWEPIGHISAKGFGEPLSVYRPLAHRAVSGKGRGIPGLASPLVGRDTELDALQDALEHLRAGVGGIVTVVGEAGIGKSRLVAEVRRTADRRPTTADGAHQGIHDGRPSAVVRPTWVEGRCLSYAADVAYSLWLDLLRGLLDVTADASPIEIRDALYKWLYALCPDCLDDVYPYLGRMLSLSLEEQAEARLRGLEAKGLKTLTFRAVEALTERAARQQPLVIVCEDLHWADSVSLELLGRLLPLTERVPLLFLCVFRPLRDHGCWQIRETAARDHEHRHTDLRLQPLSPQQSAALVGNLLHVEDLPDELRRRILARAEGNPFFVEEILRALLDEGAIARDAQAGRWHATRDVADIPIPDTVHGVIAARIDRLPEETRRVLQQAAVLGRIFTYPLLAAIDSPLLREGEGSGGRVAALDAHLLILQRVQLIRERARLPEREYAFKHVLTQEAAYDGLLRRERRAVHRRAAQALERLYPERLEEQFGLLAHHWEQAGETERAVDYYRRAGVQAAAQFANEEAVAYLSRALDLAPEGDLAGRYALLLTREDALDLLGAREAQRRDLAALEALAEDLADPGRQADVALRQAHYAARTQDYDAAREAAQWAIRWAQDAQDVARQAAAHRELGRALRYRGDDDAARVELEQALLLARAAGSRQVEADALHDLGALEWGETTGQEEAFWAEELRICRQTGNRRDEGRALRDLGLSFLQRARYSEAKAYFEESLQVCLETGNRRDEGWALHSLALVYNELGDHTTAHAYGEQALHVHNETGDRLGKAWTCAVLCRAYAHAGDYAGARDWIPPVRKASETAAAWALGDLALGQGDHQRARDHYEAALRLNRAESSSRCHALCGLARIALMDGDRPQAQGYASEILCGLERGYPWTDIFLGLTPYLVCYRVLRAHGNPRAREVLDEAHRLLQERAAHINDEALRRSYLENVAANRAILEEVAFGDSGA
jgi:predicted ATPase/class 3 adenylate cyclase